MLDFDKAGGLVSGDRPGCRHRRSADDRLDEPRGVRRDGAHRPGRLLQPQPQQALAQGRGERPRAGGARRSSSTATPTRSCSRSNQIGGAACHEGYKSCFFRQRRGRTGSKVDRRAGVRSEGRSTRNDVQDATIAQTGIPAGSLQEATAELFRKAGYKITFASRSYYPAIDDPEIHCTLIRAQEMPRYVEDGSLDCGLTGHDWILENDAKVVELAELVFSKVSRRPVRWVLAVPERFADSDGRKTCKASASPRKSSA